MNIQWNPNPLKTIIELDEADHRFLRSRLHVEYLEHIVDSAHFALDPEHRSWMRSKLAQPTTDQEVISKALSILNQDYNTCEEPGPSGETLAQWLDKQLAHYVQALAEEHCGDCTCTPCSCMKCHAEGLLGVRTIAGLGKHEAVKIQTAFSGRDLAGAIEFLAKYDVGPCPDRWETERWELHKPRWIEEAKIAHLWLVKYKAEYFPG
jgi:hypothetical protein